jgi:hypothetical protein
MTEERRAVAVVTSKKLHRPHGLQELEAQFGKFAYTDLSKGLIDIDDGWERANLVILKRTKLRPPVQVHRLIADWLDASLELALAEAPGYKIRLIGGHAARRQRNDAKGPISTHAWGVAFDINWDTNPMKKPLTTDIPDEFDLKMRHLGWVSGRDFSIPDPMHYQWVSGY